MIQTNKVNFLEVHTKNQFNVTFVFTDITLADKAMKMQVRLRPDTEPVLTFSTSDDSIQVQIVDAKVEITLNKPASEIDIQARTYRYDLWVWDADNAETVETLFEGSFEVVNNITNEN